MAGFERRLVVPSHVDTLLVRWKRKMRLQQKTKELEREKNI